MKQPLFSFAYRSRSKPSVAREAAQPARRSTPRRHSLELLIPPELALSDEVPRRCWIQLARNPEQLKIGTCMHLVLMHDHTRTAPIEYRATAGSGGPIAGTLRKVIAVYACHCMPAQLRNAIEARGERIFSRSHHGLWGELELTPRALGFIARKQLRSIVTDWVEDLDGLGSCIVAVTLA